jgi:two-component system sensor histidine kinase EvgS
MYLNQLQHVQLPFPVQIMTAPDGLDGVKVYEKEMAKGNLFHFILLDLHMVHMGGLECARNIRRVETENLYPHTFIIGHSADDESEVRDKCIDVGMDDFRSKPFGQANFSEIMAKLGEIIQEKEIRQEIDSTF